MHDMSAGWFIRQGSRRFSGSRVAELAAVRVRRRRPPQPEMVAQGGCIANPDRSATASNRRVGFLE